MCRCTWSASSRVAAAPGRSARRPGVRTSGPVEPEHQRVVRLPLRRRRRPHDTLQSARWLVSRRPRSRNQTPPCASTAAPPRPQASALAWLQDASRHLRLRCTCVRRLSAPPLAPSIHSLRHPHIRHRSPVLQPPRSPRVRATYPPKMGPIGTMPRSPPHPRRPPREPRLPQRWPSIKVPIS